MMQYRSHQSRQCLINRGDHRLLTRIILRHDVGSDHVLEKFFHNGVIAVFGRGPTHEPGEIAELALRGDGGTS